MMYLDYSSTTPIDKEVLDTYTKILSEFYGNADSLHDIGRESHKLMEKSRAQIAQLFSVSGDEIVFTSCASEANSYAIKGFALQYENRGKHIITSVVEHSSVLHAMQQLEEKSGYEVSYLPVNEVGVVSIEDVKKALRKDTILVSLMYVNNETGAINPIYEIAAYVHKHSRAMMHSDCVQALGKIDVDVRSLDMATFSAHKIYGLKGSGLLYRSKNIALLPLISGGQQEFGIRGGTSNAPSNIVFAKTLRLALTRQEQNKEKMKQLNQRLRKGLTTVDGCCINSVENCIPHIINVSFRYVGSEIMLNALNAKGICVSAQSTCSSKSKARSYVLAAMGLGEERATHAIRISLSYYTTEAEIDTFIDVVKEINHDYGTK